MNWKTHVLLAAALLLAKTLAVPQFILRHVDLARQTSFNEIVPGLYLGNAVAACDRRLLQYLNLSHILTIESRRIPKTVYKDLNITTLFLKAYDSPKTYLLPYFPLTNKFIDDGVNKNGILVHCHYGVSRSATLVIAYLMEKYQLSYERAFTYVKYKRRFINPNHGFVSQLKEFERMEYDVYGFNKWAAYVRVHARNNKCIIASVAAVLLGIFVPVIFIAVS